MYAHRYEEPQLEQINAFFAVLTKDEYGYNLFTRMRHEMGQDVDAACGQLAVSRQDGGKNKSKDIKDIEDFTTSASATSPSSSSGYIMSYFHDMLGGITNMMSDGGCNDDNDVNRRNTDSSDIKAKMDGWGNVVAASAVATGLVLASVVVYRAAARGNGSHSSSRGFL